MTLFHLRELWSTNLGTDEDFDKTSICICNIDNSPDGSDKIAVGSLDGILRVFKVESNNDIKTNNDQNLFQISDLLLEVDLKLPILQISAGFLLTSANSQLAILHPEKLCVYSLSSTSGITDHGTSYNILLIYELNFDKKAANMLIGSMGQKKGKDIICIQNVDSEFTFYENESFSFGYSWKKSKKRFPVEFTYIPYKDLIVLIDELYCIQCYQFQELAMNSNMGISNSEKSAVVEWSYNFGEYVIDLQAVHSEKWFIVILGERNLCVLLEDGSLFFVKKFDVNPNCLCAFANESKDSLIILIGTEMSNMLVYQNDILRWATKIPFVPISIRRANFNNINGSVVLLSDKGRLTVGYLGTNPSLKMISMPSSENDLNSNKIEEELKDLKKRIEFDNNNLEEFESQFSDGINVYIINWQRIDSETLIVGLEISSIDRISNSKFIFQTNDFYEITPNEQFIDSLESSHLMEARIKLKLNLLPLTTKIKFALVFSIENSLRIITKNLNLPFESFIKLLSSSKSQKYSIKMNIQKSEEEKLNLTKLFDDVLNQGSNVDSFSFCFFNYQRIQTNIKMSIGENVCYSIESNDLGGLLVSLKEFFKRIKIKSPNIKVISMTINFNLIDHLFQQIKNRIKNKNLQLKHKEDVAKFSKHYRILQKRILIKSKDKTPASLDNLEKLLSLIQKKIVKNIDKLIYCEKMINISNYHVWADLNILKLIVKKLAKKETEILKRFIKPISVNRFANFTEDWEDLFQSSLQGIITVNKETGSVVQKMEFDDEKNLINLEQTFNQVFKEMSTNLFPIDFIRSN